MNYPRRFQHLGLLLISVYTVHFFGKMVKRKFQEVLLGPGRVNYARATAGLMTVTDNLDARGGNALFLNPLTRTVAEFSRHPGMGMHTS